MSLNLLKIVKSLEMARCHQNSKMDSVCRKASPFLDRYISASFVNKPQVNEF